MKIETEFKYRIDNPKTIKRKLLKLGFSRIKEVSQKDYYFSPPHKTFAGTKKYYLRLRRENRKGIFAYHIVRNNLQTKEWEVQITKFDTFLSILKFLDFRIDCVVRKNRLIYRRGDIEILIDKVKDLGAFIEIEYRGKKFTQKVKKEFTSIINTLQIKEESLISGLGYPDLIMAKS